MLPQFARQNGIYMDQIIPRSHGEGVDIFVKSVQKEYGLNDHIINSINIEFDLCSAITVSQPQLSLL